MNDKHIAVIMSLYKNDVVDFVKLAVESILNQTYKELDFFIQYDGPIRPEVDEYLTGLKDERVKIQRRAEIDALTNVYNHKAFEEKCEKELAKGKANAIFLMMDVDDFKLINDTQGHNVGDLVLSQTGAILNEAVSGHGFAGRLGGDEFAVFVWDLGSIDEMRAFVSQLRDNLKTIIFDMEYSASIGVGVLDSDAPLTFKDMYFRADQAVYAAKHHGKNQIVFYEDIDEKAADETEEVLIEDPAEMAEDADERAILTQLKECLYRAQLEDVFIRGFGQSMSMERENGKFWLVGRIWLI